MAATEVVTRRAESGPRLTQFIRCVNAIDGIRRLHSDRAARKFRVLVGLQEVCRDLY